MAERLKENDTLCFFIGRFRVAEEFSIKKRNGY
jgi:hypothetical protein